MMKKTNAAAAVLLLTAVLLFSGCSSLVDSITDANASMRDAIDRTEARAGQAVLDAAGVGALEDSMIATIVYAQVFFAGGYAAGYEDFEEGEGVVWRVVSAGEEEESSLEIERALLKRLPDGSQWWLLRYQAEGEDELVSEALLSNEYELVTFRYRHPESGAVREWIPETEDEAESGEGEEAAGEDFDEEDFPGEDAFYSGDYDEHIVGTETVRVPAGSYRAEHVKVEDTYETDSETGETGTISYEWWLTDDVPGRIVKYIWMNTTEESTLSGELISNRMGYTTQLDSF